ncbi:MAG: c-type cytochrome [Balneolaceae bacterium]|nr:c-type cytochrome [Balneolaceae bacterium]
MSNQRKHIAAKASAGRSKKASRILPAAAALISLLLFSCRGDLSKKPPIHPQLNMDVQKRFESQERNAYFADKMAMRKPVEGTVPRGGLKEDTRYYQGINADSSFVESIPARVNKSFIYRGQDRYNIYCAPCHGLDGEGRGIIMAGNYGYVPAPSYHTERIRNLPDGELYSAIANGVRSMPSYASQVPVEDRWAIVAYIRALQLSRFVPEEQMKQYEVDLASLRDEYQKQQEAEAAKKEAQAAAGGGDVSVARGEEVASNNACMTCHSTDGTRMTGPTWQNLYGHEAEMADGTTVVADEEYLRESIVNSNAKVVAGYAAVMPNYDYLSDSEIQSLIEYIKSLSDKSSADGE